MPVSEFLYSDAPRMELIDFLEGGPPKKPHTQQTETQWLAKTGFGMKTKFLVETTFLIHLGSSTVLLGLKNPQGWSVQLIELMEEETFKEVRELPRVRLLTRGGKLGLGSSIWMVSGVLVPLHRSQWASCLKMQALQTQEWELGIWEQAQEPICWQASAQSSGTPGLRPTGLAAAAIGQRVLVVFKKRSRQIALCPFYVQLIRKLVCWLTGSFNFFINLELLYVSLSFRGKCNRILNLKIQMLYNFLLTSAKSSGSLSFTTRIRIYHLVF